jgi:hypothetical protein
MNTMQDVATEGAKTQAEIDKYLTKAFKAARRLEEVNEKGVELGMVKPIRGKTLIAEARAATGKIAAAAHAFAVLHKEQTFCCVENGCDVPALGTVGGITTFGGGDR